jgi:hypothetical protein
MKSREKILMQKIARREKIKKKLSEKSRNEDSFVEEDEISGNVDHAVKRKLNGNPGNGKRLGT